MAEQRHDRRRDSEKSNSMAGDYSSPSSGSLESVMGHTNSSSSSPQPPPLAETHLSRYMENLRYTWCLNDRLYAEPSHKIGRTPSFDVFCTDRLCVRRSFLNPSQHKNNMTASLYIAAFILLLTGELAMIAGLVLSWTTEGNIGSEQGRKTLACVISGAAVVYTFLAAAFLFGILKQRFKFVLPLTFQSILVFVAGCAAIGIVIFTSLHDDELSDKQYLENIFFCALLGVVVLHQFAFFIVAVLIYRQSKTQ